jgi:hypothetical protein
MLCAMPIWGGENCQWAYLPSSGNSGGILSIWNNASSFLIFSFIGEGFVGVFLEWGATRGGNRLGRARLCQA